MKMPWSSGSVACRTQDVLEHACAGSVGVFGLSDLTELQGIAEQDQILRGVGRGDGVSESQLTGFVDHEYVDRKRVKLLSGPQPRRTRDQVVLRTFRLLGRLGVTDSLERTALGLVTFRSA